MKTTWKYFKHSLKEVILAPIFKGVEVIFELLVPVVVANIIDVGIKNNDQKHILLMSLLLVVFALVGFSGTILSQFFSAKAAVNICTKMRNDLYKKVQELPMDKFDNIGTSTLLTRLTSDINQIQLGINWTLRLLLRSPIVVFGTVVVAFTINVTAGFIFLAVVPILFLVIFLIMKICVPKFRATQEKLDSTVRLARENLTGIRVIRAFNTEEKEISNYSKANKELRKSQILVNDLSAITNPLTLVIINSFILVLINFGAINVASGALTQGNVVALYNLISQILVEAIKFANLISWVSKAIASQKRVNLILELDLKEELNDEGTTSDSFIEFKNVSLSYNNNDRFAVSNISFKVNKGDTIGIIGGTGSGKSTLMSLLLKNYKASNGTIYLNGKELSSIKEKEVKDMIAYVPQKAVLFKGTIKDNLKWGNKNATDEEVLEAIKVAQAIDVINKKEKGLDEIVEQEGRNFSGGQKQRLCITRALVKKAPILILDDSSSALDYRTDLNLRKAIKTYSKDLTTFIISQRTASIASADTILVLNKGELVGIGKHNDLLENCSVYKEIYESQFKKGDAK